MAMSPWVSASCWAVLGGSWEQTLHCTTQVGSEVTDKFSQSNNNTERGLRPALTLAFNTGRNLPDVTQDIPGERQSSK